MLICEIHNIAEIAADVLAELLAERTAADEAHVSKRPKLDVDGSAKNLLDRMIGNKNENDNQK